MTRTVFLKSSISNNRGWIAIAEIFPVCRKETEIDYFLLWIYVGCLFGIGKMFGWLIPRNFDTGGTIGVIAIYSLVCAVYYLIVTVASWLFGEHNLAASCREVEQIKK